MRKGIANDPQRRTRIAQAALDVIADGGIRAASHRAIARQAGVPLGSLTYHFAALDAILTSAFELLNEQMYARYDEVVADAKNERAARQALVDAVCSPDTASDRELRLYREMYAYAASNTQVRELVQSFETRSVAILRTHFSEQAARAIDALLEGWWVHRSWSLTALDPELVQGAIDALADKFPRHDHRRTTA
jgi:TetR/AcrR family transcriptional regulator, regulator of biofilm formation and stress response